MKNLFKISLFLLALCVLPDVSKAQAAIPFTITNNLTCAVTVRWMVYCNTCPSPPAVPQTNPVQVIPPNGGTIVIPGATFMAASGGAYTPTNTDVSVLMIDIGGFPIWPLTLPYVDSATPLFTNTGYPACAPPTLNMSWAATGVNIF